MIHFTIALPNVDKGGFPCPISREQAALDICDIFPDAVFTSHQVRGAVSLHDIHLLQAAVLIVKNRCYVDNVLVTYYTEDDEAEYL